MTGWSRRMVVYARPHRGGLSGLIALMAASAAIDVLRPWPLKILMDSVFAGRPAPAWLAASPGAVLMSMTGATVVIFLAGWAVRALQSYAQTGLGSRLAYGLGADVFDHLQRLSLRFHGRQPTGDLVQRVIHDAACVRRLLFGVLLPLLASSLSLVSMTVVMIGLDAQLALVAMLVAPVLAFVMMRGARRMTERAEVESQRQGEVMSLAEQVFTALPAVQAFGRENHETRRFRDRAQAAGRAYRDNIRAQLAFKIHTGSVTAAGTALVMLVGGVHVLEGRLTAGSLVVFLSYLASLYSPLEALAYLSTEYAAAAAGAARVLHILDTEDRVRDARGARHLPERDRLTFRLEGVTFGYDRDRPVLHDIHFEAHPGELVALVGPTGAGKSTLLSLAPRFYDPWSGRVTVDGIDLRGLEIASVRARIAMVLQDPFILPLTVADNIAYARPSATREEIIAAAIAANAHEFIERLPAGYDTMLGERGETLSGGQKQRLSIARALLKNAPILLMDEPTSALDAVTEDVMMRTLDIATKGKTTVVIAHRLATVRRAHRIVVLERGSIVEQGSHDELLRRNGAYARIYRTQFAPARGARAPEVTA